MAAAGMLIARGEEVIGVDAGRPEGVERLAALGVEVSLDGQGIEHLQRARTVVKSPGVPRQAPVIARALPDPCSADKFLDQVVRDGALWFSEAAGNRVGRITVEGAVTEFAIPSHDSQPRAMVTHPDGSIWFVETSTNALGRIDRNGNITEHKVPTPNASLRGVTVGLDGDLERSSAVDEDLLGWLVDGNGLGHRSNLLMSLRVRRSSSDSAARIRSRSAAYGAPAKYASRLNDEIPGKLGPPGR
jgi:hypothetical protein